MGEVRAELGAFRVWFAARRSRRALSPDRESIQNSQRLIRGGYAKRASESIDGSTPSSSARYPERPSSGLMRAPLSLERHLRRQRAGGAEREQRGVQLVALQRGVGSGVTAEGEFVVRACVEFL